MKSDRPADGVVNRDRAAVVVGLSPEQQEKTFGLLAIKSRVDSTNCEKLALKNGNETLRLLFQQELLIKVVELNRLGAVDVEPPVANPAIKGDV